MDNTFIEGAKELKAPEDILNWYRNLYYKDSILTEQGIVARALNYLLPKYCHYKESVEKYADVLLKKEDTTQLIAKERQQYYDAWQKAKSEIKRLMEENNILSKNADNAFQEGLNESRELFRQEVEAEIRVEIAKKFAGELKERKQNVFGCYYVSIEDIDNRVK